MARHVCLSVMATHKDVSFSHCVIIELKRVDEEQILKYLYEHVYSYQWILREDKETESIRLCVWWRESEYKLFCTSPLRSFLKRLRYKGGYEKIHITKTLTTKAGIDSLCNGDHNCISKYYAEGPLYMYLREVLSLGPPQIMESSPGKEKRNHIIQMVSSLDTLSKLDLLQKLASTIVPQVKRELDFYQRPPEENPYILPDPPSPLITEPSDSPTYPILPDPPSPLITEPSDSPPYPIPNVFLPTFLSSSHPEPY